MKVNFENKPKSLFGCQTLITVLLVALAGLVILILAIHEIRLAVHRIGWEFSKPSSYYFRIRENRPEGSWRWEAYVSNNQPVKITLLSALPNEEDIMSWIDGNKLNMEYIFDLAYKRCANRIFIDCRLEFDEKLNHPTLIDSYNRLILEVVEFKPCSKQLPECN